MAPYAPVNPPGTIYGAPDALGRVATNAYLPLMLVRGGPPQRAARLVDRGVALPRAARAAAAQGKGHVAETVQAAMFTARSGAMSGSHSARPNPVANARHDDVQMLCGARVVGGAQFKVGSPRYVLQALRRGSRTTLVANIETRDALVAQGAITAEGVRDRLGQQGVEAPALSGAECEETAEVMITRLLLHEPPDTGLEVLVESLRAGANDGVVSFVMRLVAEVADCAYTGRPFDGLHTVGEAAKAGVRALARTGVQTALLAAEFLSKARAEFSARLIHRVASSTLAVGAVAEVIVETAIDMLAVLRSEITLEQWLRRLGVHATTAVGGVAGVAFAYALTENEPPLARLVAGLVGGYLGAKLGRAAGEAIFDPTASPSLSAPTFAPASLAPTYPIR
jgi:hypothetical protein